VAGHHLRRIGRFGAAAAARDVPASGGRIALALCPCGIYLLMQVEIIFLKMNTMFAFGGGAAEETQDARITPS
jgi:hypothetical protein